MDDPSVPLTPADRLGASRRRFLALAGAGASGTALAACATGGGSSSGSDGSDAGGGDVADGGAEKTKDNPFGVKPDAAVDVVIFNGGYGDQYAKDSGEQYKKLHPKADVKVSSTVEIQGDLQTRFIDGTPPDLFDNSGAQSMNAGALISEKKLADIEALLTAASIDGGKVEDTLLPGAADSGRFSGKLYALNYVYTVFALWYSQKLFDEKGWTPPETWEDLMKIGEAAKGAGMAMFSWGGANAADYYNTLALGMAAKEGGVEVLTNLDKLDAKAYEQDAIVKAFAAIEEAVKAGFFQEGSAGIKHTDAQAQWVTGKSVMYPSGSWIENEQKGVTPDDFAMTAAPSPLLTSGAKLPYTAIHGTAGEPFFVPAQAANGAGGLEFLRVMLSKESCENFSKVTASPTIVKDTIPEDAFGSTALASTNKMISDAGEDVFNYHFMEWYGLGPKVKPLWTQFLSGGITADQAREQSQQIIDEVREDDSIEKFDVK